MPRLTNGAFFLTIMAAEIIAAMAIIAETVEIGLKREVEST
ncbi:MAG: hypothetical protein V1793_11100 [Pseudomonadota bacterium]